MKLEEWGQPTPPQPRIKGKKPAHLCFARKVFDPKDLHYLTPNPPHPPVWINNPYQVKAMLQKLSRDLGIKAKYHVRGMARTGEAYLRSDALYVEFREHLPLFTFGFYEVRGETHPIPETYLELLAGCRAALGAA